MRKKTIYNLGWIVGGGVLFLLPIIEMTSDFKFKIGTISLASIGALILGVVLLVDYKSYHADAEQFKNWWKEIAGCYFISIFVVDFLPPKISAVVNIVFYTVFLIWAYVRYNQLKGE